MQKIFDNTVNGKMNTLQINSLSSNNMTLIIRMSSISHSLYLYSYVKEF